MDRKKIKKYYLATIECLLTSGHTELGVRMITAMVGRNVKDSIEALEESRKYLTHEAVLKALGSDFRFWETEELPFGVLVRTLEPKNDDNYTDEAKAKRRWGVIGEIVDSHDSHGLCYDVRHADGTIGHYDPDEFEIIVEE